MPSLFSQTQYFTFLVNYENKECETHKANKGAHSFHVLCVAKVPRGVEPIKLFFILIQIKIFKSKREFSKIWSPLKRKFKEGLQRGTIRYDKEGSE
jgi:hypothetical protein